MSKATQAEATSYLAEVLQAALESSTLVNSQGDAANVVDGVHDLARAVRLVADAVVPRGAAPGHDAAGGTVASLTEAVMGVTAGLHAIAASISELAAAVSEGRGDS